MARQDKETETGLIAFLGVFGLAFPILAYAAWDQALHFDPCANIFVKPGQCVGSGVSFAGGGAVLVLLGMALAGSAGRDALGKGKASLGALAVGLLGVTMAVVGSAMVYAGMSLS